MEKKNRTPRERQKYYKKSAFGLLTGEIASMLAPFFTIGIVNFDKYFVKQDGWTISIGFFIAMTVLGFTVWGVAERKFEGSFVLFIFKYAAIALSLTLLQAIINDIAVIMWFGLIGLFAAFGLDKARQDVKSKLKNLENNAKAAYDQQEIEEIKQESKDKVKIKIKK